MTKPLNENKSTEIIGQIIYSNPSKEVYGVFFSKRKQTTFDVKIGDTCFTGRTLSSDAVDLLLKLECGISPKFKDYTYTYPKINGIRVRTFYDSIENEIDIRFNVTDSDELYKTKHAIVDYVYELTKIKGEESPYERIHDCMIGVDE
jgi:hypothetical protein